MDLRRTWDCRNCFYQKFSYFLSRRDTIYFPTKFSRDFFCFSTFWDCESLKDTGFHSLFLPPAKTRTTPTLTTITNSSLNIHLSYSKLNIKQSIWFWKKYWLICLSIWRQFWKYGFTWHCVARLVNTRGASGDKQINDVGNNNKCSCWCVQYR